MPPTDCQQEAGAPELLVGPNGPIQNIYAYDTAGNPVEVLLYDEHGDPIHTIPNYMFEDAANTPTAEPFFWEGFEIRFRVDEYGRPIGNLYPLERYDWAETEARSDPQPPPLAGIPAIPGQTANTATTEPPMTTTSGAG